jgi:SUN domain-containing protein 1/2
VPRSSVRRSVPPQPLDYDAAEQALDTIPEDYDPDASHDSIVSQRGTIGGTLGTIVNVVITTIVRFIGTLIWTIFFVGGKIMGVIFDLIFLRPYRAVSSPKARPFLKFMQYLFLAGLLAMSYLYLSEPLLRAITSFPSPSSYRAPSLPAADLKELNSRLLQIEGVLSSLSSDNERIRSRMEVQSKTHSDAMHKVGSIESHMNKETTKMADIEQQLRDSMSQALKVIKEDLDGVKDKVTSSQPSDGPVSDDEARNKLKAMEDRLGTVESGLKHAMELSKSAPAVGTGAAWWNKVTNVMKGQDQTELYRQIASAYSMDGIGKPDLALYTAGGQVIPSLTSPPYEMKQSIGGKVASLVTGAQPPLGRPPITALHPDLHNGFCWPFAGSKGQLGVALAAPAQITEITIDHVSKEVVYGPGWMRSAPREMEVWAMVEGKDNKDKLGAYEAARRAKRQEALERGEVFELEARPKGIPSSYIKIASFNYNIYSSNNIQTFPVFPEIRESGMDFGIVVLRITSNWGRDEYTCLYRFRVHGQAIGDTQEPLPEDVLLPPPS